MKTTKLPGIDLPVSKLVFGCWGITTDFHWGTRDANDSIAAMQSALDAGINFFDTAEAYGDGASEELLGKAIADVRDRVVIATKMLPTSMHPNQVAVACERSLRRLGTDYIDLYQTHWADPEVPLADTWEAMQQLKQQGKVRAIGVCNAGLGHLDEVGSLEQPVTNQLPYNLLWRMIERTILPKCRELRMPVLAYSPLMHGMLTDQYNQASEVPDGRARSRHFHTDRKLARHGEDGCEKQTFGAIAAIREICDSLGRGMADVALSWVAAQDGIDFVIAGARNPAQLEGNIASLANPIPPDALEQLRQATDELDEALGPNPDMWQGASASRYC